MKENKNERERESVRESVCEGREREGGGGETPDIMAQSFFESPSRIAPHTALCYRRSAASYANLSSYKHQSLWRRPLRFFA